MILSNFEPIIDRKDEATTFAWVTVTTGSLWWKHSERRVIACTRASDYWRFVDTGYHTPGNQAETMMIAWTLQQKLKRLAAEAAGK